MLEPKRMKHEICQEHFSYIKSNYQQWQSGQLTPKQVQKKKESFLHNQFENKLEEMKTCNFVEPFLEHQD